MVEIRKLNCHDYMGFHKLINFFRPTSFSYENFMRILVKVSDNGGIWVATDEDGRLIGTATILYEEKFIHNCAVLAHIEDVCVDPELRGKGIGKKLIRHLIEEARAVGAYKVVLDCSDENLGFYTACGLERSGNMMTKRL